MDNALGVGRAQGRADLARNRDDFIEGQNTAFDPIFKRDALEEFEDEIWSSVSELVEVVNVDDVGVADARGDLCFSAKSSQRLGVFGHLRVQDLDRDPLSGQPRVRRLPNRTHAATAQKSLNLIGIGDQRTNADPSCGLGLSHRE